MIELRKSFDKEAQLDVVDAMRSKKNVGEMVDLLFTLKSELKEVQELESALSSAVEYLQNKIIEVMDELSIDKVSRKGVGTVSSKVELYPNVVDMDALVKYMYENNYSGLLQKRISAPLFREILEETGEYPDGVDAYPKAKLNITRARS